MSLFIYGTLLPGEERWHLLAPFAADHEPATAPGVLYDTGLGYPGARFDRPGRIVGRYVALGRPAAAWALLDDVEGTVDGAYRRVRISVARCDGSTVAAQSYEIGADFCDLVVIPGGDWLNRRR